MLLDLPTHFVLRSTMLRMPLSLSPLVVYVEVERRAYTPHLQRYASSVAPGRLEHIPQMGDFSLAQMG